MQADGKSSGSDGLGDPFAEPARRPESTAPGTSTPDSSPPGRSPLAEPESPALGGAADGSAAPSGTTDNPFDANGTGGTPRRLPDNGAGNDFDDPQKFLTNSKEDCSAALARIAANKLRKGVAERIVSLTPAGTGAIPYECSISQDRQELDGNRAWMSTTYTWKASALCHKPLYFEQEALERYGHSWGPLLDPLVGSAHFFGSIPLLPYKMGLEPPTECIYTLGYYRPGSCAPYMIQPFPWSYRGAALQGAAVTGLIFAVP